MKVKWISLIVTAALLLGLADSSLFENASATIALMETPTRNVALNAEVLSSSGACTPSQDA